jgi:hypothetical protein
LRSAVFKKAVALVDACKLKGDQPIVRSTQCLVYPASDATPHPAEALLKDHVRFRFEPGPVTVYLVSESRRQQVGTYSVSNQPAYREWVDVYVVQFDGLEVPGQPIGCHEVVSLDPRSSRPVQNTPEFGDPTPPLAAWIASQPANPRTPQTQAATSH